MDNPYPTFFWSLDGNADSDNGFLEGDLTVSGTGSPWATSGFWTGNGTDDYLSAPWTANPNFDDVFLVNEGAILICARVTFVVGDNPADATIFKAGVNNGNQGIELYWDASANKFKGGASDSTSSLKSKVTVNQFLADESGNTYNIYVWIDNRPAAKTLLMFDNQFGVDPENGDMGFLGDLVGITGGTDGAATEDKLISIGARTTNSGTAQVGNFYKGAIQRVWAINFGDYVPWYMNQHLVNLNDTDLNGEWWNV